MKYYELYHCKIFNIILQIIQWNLLGIFYWFDSWEDLICGNFATKSSNEILWIYHCKICNIILQMISFKYLFYWFDSREYLIHGNFGNKGTKSSNEILQIIPLLHLWNNIVFYLHWFESIRMVGANLNWYWYFGFHWFLFAF